MNPIIYKKSMIILVILGLAGVTSLYQNGWIADQQNHSGKTMTKQSEGSDQNSDQPAVPSLETEGEGRELYAKTDADAIRRSYELKSQMEKNAREISRLADSIYGLKRKADAVSRERKRLSITLQLIRQYYADWIRLYQLESRNMDFLMQTCKVNRNIRKASQLEKRISVLSQQEKTLMQILHHHKAESERLQIKQLEMQEEQKNLLESTGLPELMNSGNPNAEAVISQDFQLPSFQIQQEEFLKEELPESEDSSDTDTGRESQGQVSGTASQIDFTTACPSEKKIGSSIEDLHIQFESGDWLLPVNGYKSAGTWAYGGGGMHLGLDMAAPMMTPVRAPANGIILYADNPVDSNCGYLGNWCGWPLGGGNTVAMLCPVQGKVYAVTFCHLSTSILVSPGQHIKQSDIIALSGNSGNSTGPHTHIEVFALNCSLEEAASYFSAGADFSFGCGWSVPGSCSALGCRIRPESVFGI